MLKVANVKRERSFFTKVRLREEDDEETFVREVDILYIEKHE